MPTSARRPSLTLIDSNCNGDPGRVPIDMTQHAADVQMLRSYVAAMFAVLTLEDLGQADGIDWLSMLYLAQQAQHAAARADTIASWLEDHADAITALHASA